MNSQDFHNWCQLEFFMAKGASKFLRSHFKKLWQTQFNKPWDNSSGQDLVKIIKPISFKSYFKSQQSLLQKGDIENWDLQLLRNVFVDSDICGAGKQGDDLRKNVQKLAEFRNKLAHNASKNVSDADFEVNWEKISKILIEMGESKDELDELKVSLRSNRMMILRSQNITKANEMKLKGNEYFKEKKFPEAISSYTDAIDLKEIPDQDLAALYANRSVSYLKRWSENKNNSDDIQSALRDAKECKKLRPEWSKAYFRLGKAYIELDKLDKAIKAFEKALNLQPNNEEVKNALNDTRRARGRQHCYAHLDPGRDGVTQEQVAQDFYMRTGRNFNPKYSTESRKFLEIQNPVLKDVFDGHDYRDGTNGVEKDLAKAIQCYWRAVKKGNAEAMYNIALLTQEGEGVKQDYALAFSLYQRAAEQPPFDTLMRQTTVGVAEAQEALGTYYLNGIHVDKNEFTAIYWFERGVENGFGRSANDLGLMYLDGQGVTRNLKRAEQYLLFAFSHEDHNAAGNLVSLFLELGDAEKAIKWNKIAIEKGSLLAIGKQEDLEALNCFLQEKLEIEMNGVEEWEKTNNLSPENLAPGERLQRKAKSELGKGFTFLENFKRNRAEIRIPPKFLTKSSKISRYNWEELGRYSEESHTARIMFEAMYYFFASFSLLIDISEDVRFDNELCHEFIFNLAKCLRLEQSVISFPLQMIELAKKIAKMSFSHIHSLRERKELDEKLLHLDQDARFCFAWLSLESPDAVIEFLSESMRKYPKNPDFLRVRGDAYGFKYQYEDALRDANQGLEIEPENYEFLYLKAVSLRVLSHSNAIKAYEEFLSKAPDDHRKVPEAYYAMGTCILVSEKISMKSKKCSKEALKIIQEYYEQGEEMEKKQLPCFLPYESNSKKVLEPFVNPKKFMEEVKPPSSTQKEKLKDPLRKQLILLHRRTVKNWRSNFKEFDRPYTFKPPKKQKLPQSLIGLKQTYLNEIDFTKDHILTGYVLELIVIDIVNPDGMSIQFVAEDKNEHVQRVALYNFDESLTEVKELGIGSKFSIINPYIRMAVDCKPLIRVDDPLTVIFGEKRENICAYCGDSPATFTCGRCLTTWYCSEKCQIEDWKKFEHKLICVKRSAGYHSERKKTKSKKGSDHLPISVESKAQDHSGKMRNRKNFK